MTATPAAKEQSPFFAFKSWAFHAESCLSHKARSVGLMIADHMRDDEPTCFVSLPRLAELTGQSQRSVWAAVQELIAARIFASESGSRTGVKRANTYTLLPAFRERRPKPDPRNICKGSDNSTLAKSEPGRASTLANSAATLATFANQPPKNLLTEEPPYGKRPNLPDEARRVESIRDRMRRVG